MSSVDYTESRAERASTPDKHKFGLASRSLQKVAVGEQQYTTVVYCQSLYGAKIAIISVS